MNPVSRSASLAPEASKPEASKCEASKSEANKYRISDADREEVGRALLRFFEACWQKGGEHRAWIEAILNECRNSPSQDLPNEEGEQAPSKARSKEPQDEH